MLQRFSCTSFLFNPPCFRFEDSSTVYLFQDECSLSKDLKTSKARSSQRFADDIESERQFEMN